ncbi:MAG: S-layer homology domain-containing protein [Tumebacillaceae bacterium]
MKKFIAVVSALSILSMSVVPAMAHGNENKGQKINIHFHEDKNTKISLNDINGHWAKKYIEDLVQKGVLSGDDHHRFNPNTGVSRAQWAVMVTKYFDLPTTATTQQDFTDVKTDFWGYTYIEAAKDYFDAYRGLNGAISFHPNEAAKREDVTVTLVKVLMKLDPSIQLMSATDADTLLKAQFTDADQIASVLRPYVATAVQNNLIHGDVKGHFLPLAPLQRAQAATMLDLLLDTGIVVDTNTTNPGDNTNTGGGGTVTPDPTNTNTNPGDNTTPGDDNTTSGN